MLLKEKWDELVRDLPEREIAQRHYEELVKAYSDEKRFYHNLNHLKDFYQWYETYREEVQSPQVFQFAIWYHDCIYKILHTNVNERLSARKARLQLQQLGLEPEKIRQVEALILDTRFHRIEAGAGLPDAPWFLDMDLAILGAEAERYDVYREQIRQEYWVIPSSVYKIGRVKTLRRLLERERIFHTDPFYKKLEDRARNNIERELADLKSGKL